MPSKSAADFDATWRTRALWLLLAFIPSSLTLGVTQFLSTDVAAVPLLWVIPLAIYLLTFIIAFGGSRVANPASISKVLPIAVVAVAITFFIRGYHLPAFAFFALHLASLFLSGLLCHSRLAATRPGPDRLTEFYLIIAMGGVLGGMFNSLLAPLLFRSIAEYPIVLVLACLLRVRPAADAPRRPSTPQLALDGALVVLIAAVVIFTEEIGDRLGLPNGAAKLALGLGVPAVLCYLLAPRRISFALGAGALVGASLYLTGADGLLLRSDRTFFGIYRVIRAGGYTRLIHGTTDHGMQSTDPAKQRTPLTYYHPDSPIGQVFAAFGASPLFDRVGLVGLGTGALAAYGREGQRMTFHEIDPAVVRIAQNPAFFTYLRDCRATYNIVLGDGRLTLAAAPDGTYGLIVLDAFSSDAIPLHLMTVEALDIDLAKLRPHGLIAFHISNQFLDLGPIVARLAAERGLAVYERSEGTDEIADRFYPEYKSTSPKVRAALENRVVGESGHYPSNWIVLARDRADLGPLLTVPGWRAPQAPGSGPLWTDDYSNILSVFHWN